MSRWKSSSRQLESVGVRKWVFSESIFCEKLGSRTQNPLAMWLKKRYPDRCYFWAAADFSLPLPEQVRTYHAIGTDGWKLVNGKPDRYSVALDSPSLEPLFDALEKSNLPLFWHVGDPKEFWSPETLPRWALKEWSYTDSHPSLERLRAEAMRVLDRHPRLKVVFAYFCFSSRRDAARRFFTEHADRIVVGSYGSFSRQPAPVLGMIRRFLETEEVFDPPHGDPYSWPDDRAPITGIGLSESALEKIYFRNYERLLGATPRALDQSLAVKELERIRAREGRGGLADQVLGRW